MPALFAWEPSIVKISKCELKCHATTDHLGPIIYTKLSNLFSYLNALFIKIVLIIQLLTSLKLI